MGDKVLSAIMKQVEQERFARKMGMKLIKLEPGYALVEMMPHGDMTNILGMIHGGAIFSLIDEAFQVSCNAYGTIDVALNMAVTYHQPPDMKGPLQAESKEVHRSRKTGTYDIKVRDGTGNLIASCMALAYRKKEKLPFLDPH